MTPTEWYEVELWMGDFGKDKWLKWRYMVERPGARRFPKCWRARAAIKQVGFAADEARIVRVRADGSREVVS